MRPSLFAFHLDMFLWLDSSMINAALILILGQVKKKQNVFCLELYAKESGQAGGWALFLLSPTSVLFPIDKLCFLHIVTLVQGQVGVLRSNTNKMKCQMLI